MSVYDSTTRSSCRSQGLQTWDIPQTEMYDEPHHIPHSLNLWVFEERWNKGEQFS